MCIYVKPVNSLNILTPTSKSLRTCRKEKKNHLHLLSCGLNRLNRGLHLFCAVGVLHKRGIKVFFNKTINS